MPESATSPAIPASILDAVLHALREHEDMTPIRRVQRVKGGYESASVRITTRRRDYFLKWSAAGAHGGFQAEAAHLALLAATGAVAVPAVLLAVDPPKQSLDAGTQAPSDDAPGCLLMEWLTPPSREVFQRRVGRDLGAAVARMHAVRAVSDAPIAGYGPAEAIHGAAAWRSDWVAHFRDELLRPQIDLAAQEKRLSAEGCARLERLLNRLDAWLGDIARQPALIHGDLHRSNVLCTAAGTLVLIDPHPFFADRELELAYMDWVGGFPPAFYLTYEATYPCVPGRQERRDLYLLYWRLQRLNWAGSLWSNQAASIEATARIYVGA